MSSDTGWRNLVPRIMDAGLAARRAPAFDARARTREVEARVKAAKGSAYWLTSIVGRRAQIRELRQQLARETAALERDAELEGERLQAAIAGADAGDPGALDQLLARWLAARPKELETLHLELRPLSGEEGAGEWLLEGRAIGRQTIEAGIQGSARVAQGILEERLGGGVDEQLSELNAAAVLSALVALFSGATLRRVQVRLMLTPAGSREAIAWVWMLASVNGTRLRAAIDGQTRAVDSVRVLGGDVGRCQALRYTPARTSINPSGLTAARASVNPRKTPEKASPPAIVPNVPSATPSASAEVVSASVTVGKPEPPASPKDVERPPAPETAAAAADAPADTPAAKHPPAAESPIAPAEPTPPLPPRDEPPPRPPVRTRTPARPRRAVRTIPLGEIPGSLQGAVEGFAPTPTLISNESFAAAARRYAGYPGDPTAPFVVFQHHSASYARMDARQLAYYFRWRNAARSGATIRTDFGYILVHAYELLHLAGAFDAPDAARQLERLWTSHRTTFPELDDVLISWTADLLALEVSQDAAVALFERALLAGARLRDDEAMLVVDRYWEQGNYAAMPSAGIALLAGDPHLWERRFYQQHNAGPAGAGWVDRAYREALAVTDRVVTETSGRSPRELAIERHGRTEVGRTAFLGAVYDLGRKSAVLGSITSLPHAAPVANTYRNALRYTERLLGGDEAGQEETRGRLVRAELAKALDARMAEYLKHGPKDSPREELKLPVVSAPRPVAFQGARPTSAIGERAPSLAVEIDGFGSVELEVLRVVSLEPLGRKRDEGRMARLRALARLHSTTPLELIQRVNEAARSTPFGNRVIEVAEDGPRIQETAKGYVDGLLGRRER